jgi:hypothetical protein
MKVATALISMIVIVAAGYHSRAEQRVPADLQAAIIVKLLSYERSLEKKHSARKVNLGILGDAKQADSVSTQDAMLKAFERLETVKVFGHRLVASELTLQELASADVQVVYLTPGLEASLGDILKVTRDRKILSITANPKHLDAGASVGIFAQGKGSKIVINLDGADSEGADFSSRILRIAKLVRKSQ